MDSHSASDTFITQSDVSTRKSAVAEISSINGNTNSVENEPKDETEDIALCLVQDLFQCLNLKYTNSVFKHEIGFAKNLQKTRDELKLALQLTDSTNNIPPQKEGHQEETRTNHNHSKEELLDQSNNLPSSSNSGSSSSSLISCRREEKPLLFEILKQFWRTKNIQQSTSYMHSHDSEHISINTETYIETTTQTSANQTSES